MKSISKAYAIRIAAPDPDYAVRVGISCPKFSERLKVLKNKKVPHARQLAEREHLINLSKQFPKHLLKKYPNYRKELGQMLRTDSNTEHKGGFKAPYTLD